MDLDLQRAEKDTLWIILVASVSYIVTSLCLSLIAPFVQFHLPVFSSTAELCFFSASVAASLFFAKTTATPRARWAYAVLFLLVLPNVYFGGVILSGYGDEMTLSGLIDDRVVFPRWLLGTALLSRLYHALYSLLHGWLPEDALSSDGYVRILGALTMNLTAYVVIKRSGGPLRLILPLTCPIWLVLSSGYSEYYPFIAPLYLLALWWSSERFKDRALLWVGALTAAVALSYAGFAPVVALILAAYAAQKGATKAAQLLFLTAVLMLLGFSFCWDEPWVNFPESLVDSLNLGNKGTAYYTYMEQAQSQELPFFNPAYALSADHLRHLLFLLCAGVGPVLLLLLLTGPYLLFAEHSTSLRAGLWNQAWTLLLCLYQLCYLLLMIPKLGPLQDLDLFFAVYITLAFVAGIACERSILSLPEAWRARASDCVLAACISSSLVITFALLFPERL